MSTTIYDFIEGIYAALGGPSAPECKRFINLIFVDGDRLSDELTKRFRGRSLMLAMEDLRVEVIAMMDAMEGKTSTAAAPSLEQIDADRQLSIVADEIRAVMRKHKVGGVVALASMDRAGWVTEFPEWSCVQPDPDPRVIVTIRATSSTAESRKQLDSTLGMLVRVREMCSDTVNLFGRVLRTLKQELERQGVVVEIEPSSREKGIFPAGRNKGN